MTTKLNEEEEAGREKGSSGRSVNVVHHTDAAISGLVASDLFSLACGGGGGGGLSTTATSMAIPAPNVPTNQGS